MRWPLHPEPQPCESLTSWMYRTAAMYDYSAAELLRGDLNVRGPLGHIDLHPSQALLDELVLRTGVTHERMALMHLSGLTRMIAFTPSMMASDQTYLGAHSILLEPDDRRTRWHDPAGPWFYHRRFAFQHHCLDCEADTTSYGRLYWRLPLMFSCPKHREPLLSRRVPSPYFLRFRPIEEFPEPVFWLDTLTEQGLATGYVDFFGRSVTISLWLQLLRTVIDELMVIYARKPRAENFVRDVWRAVGNRPCLSAGQTFESIKTPRQVRMMHGAAVALRMIGTGKAYPFGSSAHLLVSNPRPLRLPLQAVQ